MKLAVLILTSVFLYGGEPSSRTTEAPGHPLATCKGKKPCKACKNCKYCRHCHSGGRCGICSR